MTDLGTIRHQVPRKLIPALQPARYIALHGGRGAAKSHFFGEKLVLRCLQQPTRWACIREVQNTLKDSVHQLLNDKIQKFGLGNDFRVLESEIRGPNNSLIIFRGMQSYNAESIKSLEGFDGVWVEEAQTLSDHSLRMLRPTLRKEQSELWFSWNPRHDTDAVDKLFRGPHPPPGSIVIEVNWQDNPWFPEVLRREKDADFIADSEMADHVWGGGYLLVSEGAYYARAVRDAEREGRLGFFPCRPNVPVVTAWDIGVDDYTAIWFIQMDGLKATVIDYYECSGDHADEIIATALPEVFKPPQLDARYVEWSVEDALEALGRDEPYKYGTAYLPHDIKVREWGSGARSRVESLMSYGLTNIHKGASQGPAERIAAVRKIMPVVRFNKTTRVEMGLRRLRRYRRKFNDALQTYTTPEHDENSHGADAFGEWAINCGIFVPPPKEEKKPVSTALPTLNQIVEEHERNQRFAGDRI